MKFSDAARKLLNERWRSLTDRESKVMGLSIGSWIPPDSPIANSIQQGQMGPTELTQAANEFLKLHPMDITFAAYDRSRISDADIVVTDGIPLFVPKDLRLILNDAQIDYVDGKVNIIRARP